MMRVGTPDADVIIVGAGLAGLACASYPSQLVSWFGAQTQAWRHLRTYRIPFALPSQNAPSNAGNAALPRIREGVYICGDHRGNASIEGALLSGRRAAEAIIHDIGRDIHDLK